MRLVHLPVAGVSFGQDVVEDLVDNTALLVAEQRLQRVGCAGERLVEHEQCGGEVGAAKDVADAAGKLLEIFNAAEVANTGADVVIAQMKRAKTDGGMLR